MFSAKILAQLSCSHAIGQWHVDPVVRLHRRHRCHRRCGGVRLRRGSNGGFHTRRARRRIDARYIRDGAASGIECAAQHQLLSPGIKLPGADAVFARHHRRRHIRLQALGHDLALLLGRPTTALAADVHLGAQAPCARTISRTSIPRLRSALRHAVLFHHRRHLPLNGPRRARWCSRSRYASPAICRATASVRYARGELRNRLRGSWSSNRMRARQVCGAARHGA